MQSKNCGSFLIKKDGKNSSKNQRFKCKDCLKRFVVKKKNKTQSLLTSYIKEKKILITLAKENKKSVSTIYNYFKLTQVANHQS